MQSSDHFFRVAILNYIKLLIPVFSAEVLHEPDIYRSHKNDENEKINFREICLTYKGCTFVYFAIFMYVKVSLKTITANVRAQKTWLELIFRPCLSSTV